MAGKSWKEETANGEDEGKRLSAAELW